MTNKKRQVDGLTPNTEMHAPIEGPPKSKEWAEMVKPIAFVILGIFATIIILPMILSIWARPEQLLFLEHWAGTVLAGFIGIVFGVGVYFFGKSHH